jgi:hypothetical protein
LYLPFATTVRRGLARARRPAAIVAVLGYVLSVFVALTGGIDVQLGPVPLQARTLGRPLVVTLLATIVALLGDWRALAITGDRPSAMRVRGRRWTLLAWTGLGLAAVVGLWAAAAAASLPVDVPLGDMALLELYTRRAADGTLAIGPYSRFGWHHPGPILFYAYEPFYALFGSRFIGLRWAALTLNLASLVLVLAIAWRYGRGPLSVALACGLGLFILRYPDVLGSPWNAHILIFPLACLLVVCAAVVSRHGRWWPMAAIAASLLTQSHVGTAPTVLTLGVATFAWLLFDRVAASPGPADRRWFGIGLGVLLLLWLPPIVEELGPGEGNLTAIWRSFRDLAIPGPSSDEATAAFADVMTAAFLPGFELAWGGRVLTSASPQSRTLVFVTFCALPWAVVSCARRGDLFGARLAGLSLCASVAALWSAHRVQGPMFDQVLFWMAIVGVTNVTCVVAALVYAVAGRIGPVRPVPGPAAATAPLLVVCIAAWLGVQAVSRGHQRMLDNPRAAEIAAVAVRVEDYLTRSGATRPLVRLAQATWGDAAGVILALDKAGVSVGVEPNRMFMFGPSFAATGAEDCEIVFADADLRSSLSASHEPLASWDTFSVHAVCRQRRGVAGGLSP